MNTPVKIIYTPNSYCRIFDFPAKNDLYYEYFAGRNVVLNVPLTDRTYFLEFTIQNYVVNLKKDSFNFTIPLLFGSKKVTIDTVNIVYNAPYLSKFEILAPKNDKYPINAYIPKVHATLKDILKIGFTNTSNQIIAISQLGGKIYSGSRRVIKNKYPIELKGPVILSNYHKLKLDNEINIGIKKIDSPLPLSIYNLLKKNPKIIIPPILEYFIYNTSDETISLEIHSHLPELSYPEIETVLVQPNKLFRYKYIPTIIPSSKANITVPFETVVISKIINKNSNQILKEETNTIKILPNDTMIFRMLDESTGMTQMFYNYLVNWVKRFESPRLDSLLKNAVSKTYSGRFFGYDKSAANRAIQKGEFNSYAEFTRNIVEAIYESLHSLKPIYSNETLDFGRTNYQMGQRIKYPAETLEQGRGNCIDSSVLFATLLEIIGINPRIVIVPGHAFVGWETWQNSGNFEYLESTLLGYQNFSIAYKLGMAQNYKYSNMKDPPTDWIEVINYIDVKKLRDMGLYSAF